MEYITRKGLEKLKKELDELKNVKKWEIAQWLREASSQGDLDENAEYVSAKEAQTALENKVEELEERIRTAQVITKRKSDIVGVGSKIEFVTPFQKKLNVVLVSIEESNAEKGKISTVSPLGTALFGKKVGDNIEVLTPKGIKRYRITKVI